MFPPQGLPVVFMAQAVILLTVTAQDQLRTAGKLTPSRQTWWRVALIFAGMGVVLVLVPIMRP
jgi:hypothetical protein